MIPVGGTITIDYKKTYDIINEFNPKVVIPMHYREKDSKIKILDNLDNFLNLVKDYKMMDHSVSIKKDDLPVNTEVWVLKSS